MGIRIISILLLFSLTWSAVGDAGLNYAVLESGVGPRALALGSAYVAHEPDASAVYWNPAGLAFIEQNEIQTLHTMLATDASYYYLGGAFKQPWSNWGFNWVQLQLADIPNTAATLNNNEVDVIRNLTYVENAASLAGGWQINPKLSWGLAAKYITKKISNDYGEGKGYAGTLGLLYRESQMLNYGLRVDNISAQTRYDTGLVENVPLVYTVGLSYWPVEWLTVLTDIEKRNGSNFAYGHVGLEWLVNSHLQLLCGYEHERITTGVGFRLNSIEVQYAYLGNASYGLGAEQFVSLGVRW